jgi:hypothetical protein
VATKSEPNPQDQLRELAKLALARKDSVLIRRAAEKLAAGQPITKREEAALTLAAHDDDPTAAQSYVGTWDDLAAALGKAIGGTVTRRAIQDWRNDPRYRPEIEKRWPQLERADGRKCVAEWLRLMADLNLKRGAASADEEIDPENAGDEEGQGIIRPPRVGGRQSEWTIAIAALDHRKKENAVRVQEGSLLVAADLEVPLGATFATIQTKLAQFPARVARYLVGLVDVSEVEDKLRDELDADLGDLHAAGYTADDAVAEAVAAVPFDDATNALCEKLLFDGADRTALMELAGAIATEALRQLGRRAITGCHPERSPVPPGAVEGPLAISENATPPSMQAAPATPKADPVQAKKKRARARPKTAPAPAEVEAAIAPPVRRPVTRRRRG